MCVCVICVCVCVCVCFAFVRVCLYCKVCFFHCHSLAFNRISLFLVTVCKMFHFSLFTCVARANVCVCIYVHKCVSMLMCMFVYTYYVCTYLRMYACEYVGLLTCICVYFRAGNRLKFSINNQYTVTD